MPSFEQFSANKQWAILGADLPNDLPSLRTAGALHPNVTPPIRKVSAAGWFFDQLSSCIENEPAALMFLDGLLIELRAATFTLQKLLKDRPGFDAWYEQKREEMKKDANLNWLVSARNIAEKEGIIFASWGIHLIQRHYRDGRVETESVPPKLKIDEIDREVTLPELANMLLKIESIVLESHELFYKNPPPRNHVIELEIVRQREDGSWEHFDP